MERLLLEFERGRARGRAHLQDDDYEGREGIDARKERSPGRAAHAGVGNHECLDEVKHRRDERVCEEVRAEVAKVVGAENKPDAGEEAVSSLQRLFGGFKMTQPRPAHSHKSGSEMSTGILFFPLSSISVCSHAQERSRKLSIRLL